LQSFLNWRLEKGIDVLSFSYLNKSSSLTGAYLAPFYFRCFHWIPFLLCAFWALSPLGSQAALRFVYVQDKDVQSNFTKAVQYVYPNVNDNTPVGDDSQEIDDGVKTVFLSTLLLLPSTQDLPQDLWGGIKVPFAEYSEETNGPESSANMTPAGSSQYSSFIGIPFVKPSTPEGNTTFTINTFYWELVDATVSHYQMPEDIDTAFGQRVNSTEYQNFTSLSGMWQFTLPTTQEFDPKTNTTSFIFKQWDYNYTADNIVLSELTSTVSQRFVEADVYCNQSSCETTAVRPTLPTEIADAVSGGPADQLYFMEFLFPRIANAFPLSHDGTPESGAMENILQNGFSQNLFVGNEQQNIFLYEVGADVLSLRLSQIINTYWNAAMFGNDIASNLNPSQNGFDHALAVSRSDAVIVTSEKFFGCNRSWLTVFLLATLSMIVTSVASFGLNFLRHAPISTDFLTALVKGELGETGDRLGSYLDSEEITRRLKGTHLMIGDGCPTEETGKVVIRQGVFVDKLRNGRVYR